MLVSLQRILELLDSMKKLMLFALLICLTKVVAQDTGTIVGKLIDKEVNDEPLAFANVLIKGTTKGTTSDFDGLYQITDVEPGLYNYRILRW